MTSFLRAVNSPENSPWISAMSITAIPLSVPGWAIFIAVLLTVASMWPSTMRMSQFEISTPLSLMFGPTESLLPAAWAISGAGAELSFVGVAGAPGLFRVGMGGGEETVA